MLAGTQQIGRDPATPWIRIEQVRVFEQIRKETLRGIFCLFYGPIRPPGRRINGMSIRLAQGGERLTCIQGIHNPAADIRIFGVFRLVC